MYETSIISATNGKLYQISSNPSEFMLSEIVNKLFSYASTWPERSCRLVITVHFHPTNLAKYLKYDAIESLKFNSVHDTVV